MSVDQIKLNPTDLATLLAKIQADNEDTDCDLVLVAIPAAGGNPTILSTLTPASANDLMAFCIQTQHNADVTTHRIQASKPN